MKTDRLRKTPIKYYIIQRCKAKTDKEVNTD